MNCSHKFVGHMRSLCLSFERHTHTHTHTSTSKGSVKSASFPLRLRQDPQRDPNEGVINEIQQITATHLSLAGLELTEAHQSLPQSIYIHVWSQSFTFAVFQMKLILIVSKSNEIEKWRRNALLQGQLRGLFMGAITWHRLLFPALASHTSWNGKTYFDVNTEKKLSTKYFHQYLNGAKCGALNGLPWKRNGPVAKFPACESL